MTDFAVDSGSLVAGTWVHTLRGTKDPSIVTISVNGNSDIVTYPTTSTWQVDVVLSPGANEFDLQGTDSTSNQTEVLTITVTLAAYSPVIHEVFNDLGRRAVLHRIVRLPGEKNIYMHRRLVDAPYYPTGTHYEGLVDAIARDLGLTSIRDALQIAVRRDSYLDPISSTVRVEICETGVLVDCDEMTISDEPHKVDPDFNGFYLDYEPRYEADVELFTRDRTKIGEDQYRVHGYDRKVVFVDDGYNMQWVRARYNYRTWASADTTLTALETALEAITVRGQQLLVVTASDGTLLAEWLEHRTPLHLGTTEEELCWAPVQVYNLPSQRFRDSLLNVHGAAYDTILAAWAADIGKRTKFGWGDVVLDVDTWDPLYNRRNTAYLPHLFDSYRGAWRCGDPSDTTRYSYSDYVGYGGMCPNHPSRGLTYTGVEDNEWHSGFGSGNDLLVTGADIG